MCHPETSAAAPRPNVRTEEVAIPLADGEMPGLIAFPRQTPAPGVVIVNDFFGRSPFYERLALRLADVGFVALDPEYFFRAGPLAQRTREAAVARVAKLDQSRTVEDISAAASWLTSHPEASGRVAAMGFCLGGTLVLGVAAAGDAVDATVCYYGFPRLRTHTPLSPPEPLSIAAGMRGPILGHWGEQDAGVGMENVAELQQRLTQASVAHEFHLYPDVGHGFLAHYEDENAVGHGSARQSWERTVGFLRRLSE